MCLTGEVGTRTWCCPGEPHNMPHGPNSNSFFIRSVGRKRCLVKQNKCETERIRSLTYAVDGLIHLYCSRKPLRQNGWPLQPMGSPVQYAVPCIHASCILYPRESILHHTIPLPVKHLRDISCFTDYRSALAVCGRIVEATFHLPMQVVLLENWRP